MRYGRLVIAPPANDRSFALGTRLTLLLVALLMFVPALLLGKVTGNISGTVRDAQGAVMPGVAVTARKMQTGVSQTIQTDNVGFYNFPALPVGIYEVTFKKPGFRNTTRKT